MVKPVAKAEINSFVKGLVSESSPLNFPADASRDEENFELNRDGSRNRRYGLDLEFDYELQSTAYTQETILNVAFSSYKWFSAGNNPDAEFIVVQRGSFIDIYESLQDSISSSGPLGTVALTDVLSNQTLSYAAIDGKLIIAAGTDTIHVIEWDGNSLNYSNISLQVRDLWGLPDLDGNELSTRPLTLTNAHLYNLRNQGWGIPRAIPSIGLSDPVTGYFTNIGRYPSNMETVYTGLQFSPGSPPAEALYFSLFEQTLGLGEQSSKGYFIIDALKRGISRASVEASNRVKYPVLSAAVTSFKSDTTSGGASLVADFGGRVFYAGFNGEVTDPETNSPNLSNYILFSQVVKDTSDLSKCYQSGDPTSREGSDIVDTDGGFIRISGAKKIIAMKVLSNNLFVIADNGVWKITGGSDYGFSATNYRVDKVSTSGGFAEKSVVDVEESLYFWGAEGIFKIGKNQFGDWVCDNISKLSIQKVYDDIPAIDKYEAIGIYDNADKKVRWLYGITSDIASIDQTKELVLDVTLGSFSKNRIYNLEEDSPRVVGYIRTPLTNIDIDIESVVVENVPVVVGANEVEAATQNVLPRTTTIKFITLYSTVGSNVGYTFSQYRDEDFRDWKTANGVGVDAKAYILTGTMTAGDSSIYKQTPYLVMHFLKTEEGVILSSGELIPAKQSSCKIRSQWNWANTVISGNWGSLFQAYRYRRPLFITDITDDYNNGFEVVTTKNKLRGRGRALSIYMETEPDKNCIILGWNLSITGNSLA